MRFTAENLQAIAHLARLSITPEEIESVQEKLSQVFELISGIQQVDTTNYVPMSNPHDALQLLRHDQVTEHIMRDEYQEIAPAVHNGCYLVPKVIE